MSKIVFVCRDVGGANALLPVANLLRKKNQIQWVVQENGRGKDVLKSSGQDFELYSSASEISKDSVNAFVSSMCSTAGQELAPHFKGSCPVVAIQDQWACGLYNVWNDPKCRPDYILVNDELDKDFVLKAWPDFDPDGIIITGYPALDKYAHLDVQGVKTRVKNTLSLSLQKPVVLFAGQWGHTGHAIMELVKALNEIRQEVSLIVRPHPAMKDNAPEEMPLWEQALAEFHSGTLISDSSPCTMPDVIAASDLVLSMYSTSLCEAAIMRIPNIAILYPDHGMKEYVEVAKTDNYPMVSLGCTAKASNYEELVQLVRTSLSSDLGLRSAQEKTFNLDGNNAFRAANFISSILT